MNIEKKVLLTYKSMMDRINIDDRHLSEHEKELRIIHQQGMLNSFKIFFSDDLEALGLDSKVNYYIAPEMEVADAH